MVTEERRETERRETRHHDEARRAPATPDAGAAGRPAGPDRRALRVMIVEDDRPTRAAMRRILAFAGHDVRAVETMADGLAGLSWPPDCVILDLMLPDGSGLAVLRRVRDEGLPTRVALCTAADNPAVLAEAAGLRPDRTIIKPCNVDALLVWLRSLLAEE